MSGKHLSRREFFEQAAKAGIILGCYRFGVEDAWAAHQITGKPIIDNKSMTELLNEAIRNPKLINKYASSAKSNLQRFLSAHFSLTKDDSGYFQKSYLKDKKVWDKFINIAAEKLRVKATAKTKGSASAIFSAADKKATSAGATISLSGNGVCLKIWRLTICID